MSLATLVERGIVRANEPLASLTTYKFGGPARWYAVATSEAVLVEILDGWRETDPRPPLMALGRGSNVVVSDSGYEGLVVRLGGAFQDVAWEDREVVTAGGAVSLPVLARTVVKADRGGLEFMVGVPGSVGGAVAMNAGCHGSETSEWLVDARVCRSDTGQITGRTPVDLDLSYRHSNLDLAEIVLSARFRTVARASEEGRALLRSITQWRRVNQPGGTHNAGSVFKNPDQAPAGKIIDRLGLKGYRVGGAAVSERHANFFVADETATAQDVYDLIASVARRVEDETGIRLEREIRFAGSFAGDTESPGRDR